LGASAQPLGESGILRQVVAELAGAEAPPFSTRHGSARLDVPVVDAVLHEGLACSGLDAKLVCGHV
jgi:hypothetical protein